MNKACRVVIDRGPGAVQHFDGAVTDMTDTHARVLAVFPDGVKIDEWFAIRSPRLDDGTVRVHVSIYGQ